MSEAVEAVSAALFYERVVEETLVRLERIWPHFGWSYAENFVVYRGSLWLQFGCETERRMYWVLVEDSVDVVRTWDLGEIADLS